MDLKMATAARMAPDVLPAPLRRLEGCLHATRPSFYVTRCGVSRMMRRWCASAEINKCVKIISWPRAREYEAAVGLWSSLSERLHGRSGGYKGREVVGDVLRHWLHIGDRVNE